MLCDKIVKMQSILNEKSTNSKKLAVFLFDKKEYAASINRAYYACIQQVIYLLLLDFVSEDAFGEHCTKARNDLYLKASNDYARLKKTKKPEKIGIHEFYIYEMQTKFENSDDSEDFPIIWKYLKVYADRQIIKIRK